MYTQGKQQSETEQKSQAEHVIYLPEDTQSQASWLAALHPKVLEFALDWSGDSYW